MRTMKTMMLRTIVVITICVFLYGAYWLTKHGSYWLWYEDMVKNTIREMVKQDALKGS